VLKFADEATVHRLLDYPGLVAALRRAHARGKPLMQNMMVDSPEADGNRMIALLGWNQEAIAVKVIGVYPSNLNRTPPQPSVQGVVIVFNPETGTPLLVGDGSALTVRKTAGDSALGSQFLSREDSETLLVVGAGGLGPHVAMAHTAVRPSLRKVRIWNRTHERARALADSLDLPGIHVEAVTDLDAAVGKADIITCVTMAKSPLIKGALLKPGTHLDLIGSYLPDMREADDDCIRRGTIFVDMRRKDTGAGEVLDPIARGVMAWEDIKSDLFELSAGTGEGRTSGDEITFYKNFGGGHLDMFTAAHLLARVEGRA
jgi:ornithine cyclodeaminase